MIILKGNKDENNENDKDYLPLEIQNFPKLLENDDEENININNYLEIYRYFKDDRRIRDIEEKIKYDDVVVKKVFDYVFSNSIKRVFNEIEYFSKIDFKFYENCQKYKWIKPNNLFNNFIKDIIDNKGFNIEIKKYLLYFELTEEPNEKLKYLENIYDIIKNIYELSIDSSFNNFRIYILIWEYFIIHICPINFYSSILKIHLFIRKDLLTINQTKILFQIKEVINNIINESINIIPNEYNNDDKISYYLKKNK